MRLTLMKKLFTVLLLQLLAPVALANPIIPHALAQNLKANMATLQPKVQEFFKRKAALMQQHQAQKANPPKQQPQTKQAAPSNSNQASNAGNNNNHNANPGNHKRQRNPNHGR